MLIQTKASLHGLSVIPVAGQEVHWNAFQDVLYSLYLYLLPYLWHLLSKIFLYSQTKPFPVTVHIMHFSSSPHLSFSNYSEFSHHIQTQCATEITTVLLSPVIFPCPCPNFPLENLRNAVFFIGDIAIHMDSQTKLEEKITVSWGFYSLYARNRMISLELLGMSILLKQSNGVWEGNWRIIAGTQHRGIEHFIDDKLGIFLLTSIYT